MDILTIYGLWLAGTVGLCWLIGVVLAALAFFVNR